MCMQVIKFCVSIAVLFCLTIQYVQATNLKAPREGVGQCGGCGEGALALFGTISAELCSLQNNICCTSAQLSCPKRTFIRQTDIPYTIVEPGVYVVCENLLNTDDALPAISIQSNWVTLDLAHNTISSEFTYAVQVDSASGVSIVDGILNTGAAPSLRVSDVSQLFVSDIIVAQSPTTAFALNNVIEAVFDNCYFKNSFNVASGFPAYVFLIQGSSGAIKVSNTQLVNPALNGFGVLGNTAGDGIVFENCSTYGSLNAYTSNGFYAEFSDKLLVFKNCYATDYGNYGFFVTDSSNVIFDHCIAERCSNIGFLVEASSRILFDSCLVQAVKFGIVLSFVDNISLLGCNLYGPEFTGFFYDGIRAIDGTNIYMYNNNVTNFDGSQYAVINSLLITCESCFGSAGSTGYGIGFSSSGSKLVLKNCVATNTQYGVSGVAFSTNDIVIKDSLFAQNLMGINTNGSAFTILDTRSGTPLNALADSVAGSVVITY